MTKAAYVAAMFNPYDPTFPLDAEIVAAIPDTLPGKVPTSILDLMFDNEPGSTPSKPSSQAKVLPAPRQSAAARPLDPALVDSLLAAHPNLTREEAERDLRLNGA